jgi:hypothetical protein
VSAPPLGPHRPHVADWLHTTSTLHMCSRAVRTTPAAPVRACFLGPFQAAMGLQGASAASKRFPSSDGVGAARARAQAGCDQGVWASEVHEAPCTATHTECADRLNPVCGSSLQLGLHVAALRQPRPRPPHHGRADLGRALQVEPAWPRVPWPLRRVSSFAESRT